MSTEANPPHPTAAVLPLLTPPFIDIPGLPNFRDVGGYASATHPGKVVRRGLVFRASEPSKVTEDGVARLQGLGITHVYDLRSADEVVTRPGWKGSKIVEWEGAKRVFSPVFLEEDYSPEAIAKRWGQFSQGVEGFVLAYERILAVGAQSDHPYLPFRTILQQLAGPPGESTTPILVHCSAGKDRTGVICALLLGLCGVDDEVVAHEYSLTEIGLGHRKEEFVEALTRDGPLKGQREKAERMVSAKKEAMLDTLALLRRKYGSFKAYAVEHCGLKAEEVERLRENMLVDEAEQPPLDWKRHAEVVAGTAGAAP